MGRLLAIFAATAVLTAGAVAVYLKTGAGEGTQSRAGESGYASAAPAAVAQAAPQAGDAAPQKLDIEVLKNFGDWSKRCVKGTDKCDVFQRLTVKETGERVMEFGVGKLAVEGNKDVLAQGTLLLPLGISLSAPVTLLIDKGESANVQVQSCAQFGCVVTFNMTDEVLQKMKSGQTMNVIFNTGEGKRMAIPVSLNGFGDAVASIL